MLIKGCRVMLPPILSVEELLEEGNSLESGVVFGVENSKDPSVSEVTTHEFPEDDVPGEYLDDADRQ